MTGVNRRWLVLVALAAGVTAVLFALTPSSDGVALDPGAFASGACVSYAPTSGDRGQTVFLDAGHGGIDPGGVGVTGAGRPLAESEVNLPIELDTMRLLRARGFGVVVSRTENTSVVRLTPRDRSGRFLSLEGSHSDVAARDVCANLGKAGVLVGIYMDAAASSQTAGSLAAYDPDRPFWRANARLARLLQRDVLAAMNARGWGIPNQGVAPDTNLGSSIGDPAAGGIAAKAASYDHLLLLGPAMAGYFSSPSRMPGAVLEPLYLTDPFEGSIAATRRGQQVIAQGIARAVEQFMASAGS